MLNVTEPSTVSFPIILIFYVCHLPTPEKKTENAPHFTTWVTTIPVDSTARGKYPADPQWEDTQVTDGDGMGHLHDGIVDRILNDDHNNNETNVFFQL